MNQELIDYIKQQLEAGEDKNEIIKVLQNAGWGSEEIEAVFQSLQNKQTSEKDRAPFEENEENKRLSRKHKKKTSYALLFIIVLVVIIGTCLFLFQGILFGDRVIVSKPGADWQQVEVSEFHATVFVPFEDMEVDIDFFLVKTASVSDETTTYFFKEEGMSSHEESTADFLRMAEEEGFDLVSFKTKELGEVIAVCDENTEEMVDRCMGVGILYNKRAFLGGCESKKMGVCSDTFYTVFSSMEFDPPAFFGIAGIEVVSLKRVREAKELIPEDLDYGYIILNSEEVNNIAPYNIIPEEYKEGVYPGSAVDKAGLRSGDIILKIDGKKIYDFDEAVDSFNAGDTVIITYLRDKEEKEVTLTLTAWPE